MLEGIRLTCIEKKSLRIASNGSKYDITNVPEGIGLIEKKSLRIASNESKYDITSVLEGQQ